MISETASVVIDRPIEEVFALGSDIDRLPEWNGPLQSARLTSEGPMSEGSTYQVEVSGPLGLTQTVRAEITEYQPPHRVCFATTSGMRYTSCRIFEETSGGTRVVERLEADPGPIARLVVAPMVRSFARTQQENLEALRRLMQDGVD